MSNKKPKVYVPKNRRILDDHGNFSSFAEDHEESDRVYAENNTTREEVEEERALKRMSTKNMDSVLGKRSALAKLPDSLLEKELARRQGKSAPESKPAKEKNYNTAIPKPTAKAGKPDGSVSPETANAGTTAGATAKSDADEYKDTTVAEIKAKLDEMGAVYSPSSKKPKLWAMLQNDGLPTTGMEDGMTGDGL